MAAASLTEPSPARSAPPRSLRTIGQQWIINGYCAGANQDGIAFVSQFMRAVASFSSGNPTRVPLAGGNLPIQRNSQLEVNKRASCLHEVKIFLIKTRRLRRH